LNFGRGGETTTVLQGKKVIAVGERDGISGPAIAACAKAAGAEVVFVATECFV
jgi:glycine/sarcosine/betaine reductase complex component A